MVMRFSVSTLTPYRPLRQTLKLLKLWARSNTGRPPFVEPVVEEPIHFVGLTRNINLRPITHFALPTNINRHIVHHHRLHTPCNPDVNNLYCPGILLVNSDYVPAPAALSPIIPARGSCILRYFSQWQKITTDKWVLDIIKYGHTL